MIGGIKQKLNHVIIWDQVITIDEIEYSLSQLREYSRKLLAGRLLIALGILLLTNIPLAIMAFASFMFAKFIQDYTVQSVEAELLKPTPNLALSINQIWVQATIRNTFMVMLYGGIILAQTRYSNVLAAVYLFTHGFTFFFQHASIKKVNYSGFVMIAVGLLGIGGISSLYFNNADELVMASICSIALYLVAGVVSNQVMSILSAQDSYKKQAELAKQKGELINEELELRNNLETAAGVGVYKWFFESNEHMWSNGTYLALGVDPDNGVLCKDEFLNRINPEDKENYLELSRRAKNDGSPFYLDFSFLGDDNKFRHIYFYGSPIIRDDKIVGMYGIVVDQTDLKNSLARATQAQKILQLALKTSRSVVFEKDYSKNTIRAFGSLRAEAGREAGELRDIENFVRQCMTKSEIKLIENLIYKAEKTGEIQNGEHRFKYPDGHEIDAKVSVFVEGQPSKGDGRMISITTDISDEIVTRQHLSDALETAKKANRAKTEFLANMSHEIRTPLNGIIALADLLANSKLSAKQNEMINVIQASSDTLLALLNDILDLARVESGRLEIDKTQFNLNDTLQTSASLFKAKALEKGLEFTCNIDRAADEMYLGDPNRIKQIISNLVSNSIKFTKSGQISLDAHIVEATDKNLLWQFTITDTGTGIAPENLAKLFERFEQGDGSITREHGGSGLGLSICKGLCELMGGTISAQSVLGEGTTITLNLPLEAGSVTESENGDIAPNLNNYESQSLKILAAEDNETNRKVLGLVLASIDAEIDFAFNGEEAIKLFENSKYDVVLMDLQMPVLDGLRATRKIRELEKAKGLEVTPIIALSANAMKHHIKEAMEAGANGHIPKPFTPELLMNGIAKVLDDLSENNDNAAKKASA